MIAQGKILQVGHMIQDHKSTRERTIVLEQRINPMGSDIPPYWRVVNKKTRRVTIIRENRLFGKRWSIVEQDTVE